MHLIYFDETGDPGAKPGSTIYFVVSALFVQEQNWETVFAAMKDFRKHLREKYGIPLAAEIKGYSILRGRLEHSRNTAESGAIRRLRRLELLREIVRFLSGLATRIEVQNVRFRKSTWPTDENEAQSLSKERFVRTWQYSLQRAEAHVYCCEQKKKSEIALSSPLKAMQHQIPG